MQADEALGVLRGLRQLGDRQRGGRAADDRVLAGERPEAAQQLGLRGGLLDDGLDEERRLAQRVEVADDLDPRRVDVLELSAGLLHGCAGPILRGVGARPEHDLAVLGGRSGQSTGDCARSSYAKSLVHAAA